MTVNTDYSNPQNNIEGEMHHKISSNRYSYKDSGHDLLFILPSNKKWFPYVIYSLIALLWTCLFFACLYWQIHTIQALQSIRLETAVLLIVISLILDGLMACFGLFILWQLSGHEVVKVENNGIHISYKVLNAELFPKHFQYRHIRNLHISVPKGAFASGLLVENSYWDKYEGYIVFDYEDNFGYFGKGLGVKESEEVLRIIKNRFPQYF